MFSFSPCFLLKDSLLELNLLQFCVGFEWDQFNIKKNWDKHKIPPFECEQIFLNQPLIIAQDVKHSQIEERLYALGKTDSDKKLLLSQLEKNKFE